MLGLRERVRVVAVDPPHRFPLSPETAQTTFLAKELKRRISQRPMGPPTRPPKAWLYHSSPTDQSHVLLTTIALTVFGRGN